MKSLLTLVFVLSLFFQGFAADGDTLKVQSHDRTHWSWFGSYFDTVQFPDTGTYRKVLMYYTLGCPDQGCSEWDYTTRIEISDPVNDSVNKWIELVRIITPYAGDKTADWEHTWTIDVTDYVELLKGERRIHAQYSGYQDGFTVSVRFDMIEGTPPRDVVGFDQLYHGAFPYGYANDPIEDNLVPTDVAIDANAEAAITRMVASGHGFNGNGPDPGNPDNCAEFCDKWFRVFVDNAQVSQTTVWRDDCGSNVLEAQTGTWIYNRAGWCPGDVATRYDNDITPYLQPGQDQEINIDWEPYTYTSGSSFGINYRVETQVIQYGAWNHETDLSIERVLQPSNDDRMMNINPYCGDATVEIRNVGSRSITFATIDYWVEGGIERKSIDWTGSLPPGAMTEVVLPMEDFKLFGGMTDQVFHAMITKVNADVDDYAANDHFKSRFELPAELPSDLIIITSMNGASNQTSIRIEDASGNEVFGRPSMPADETFNDTLSLAPGCYTMYVEDSGCDGLDFFANNDGNGRIRIHPNADVIFPWIHEFEAGFGCETQYSFSVDYALGGSLLVQPEESMAVYPNPTQDHLNIELNVESAVGELQVIDLTGRVIATVPVTSRSITVDDLPAGQYLIQYANGDVVLTQRAIVLR